MIISEIMMMTIYTTLNTKVLYFFVNLHLQIIIDIINHLQIICQEPISIVGYILYLLWYQQMIGILEQQKC